MREKKRKPPGLAGRAFHDLSDQGLGADPAHGGGKAVEHLQRDQGRNRGQGRIKRRGDDGDHAEKKQHPTGTDAVHQGAAVNGQQQRQE
jgi:hypothetical protein